MTSTSPSTAEYKLILVQEPTTGVAFEDNLLGRIGLAPPLILEMQVLKDGKVKDVSAELPFLICQCSLLDESGAVADMVHQTSVAAGNPSPNTSSMPPTPTTRGRRGRSSLSRRGTSASAVSTRSSESTEASASAASEDAQALIDATSAAASQQTRSSFSVPRPSLGRDSPPRLARMLYGTIMAGPQQCDSLQDEEKPYFFFPEISVRTPGKFKIQCKLMRLSLPGMPIAEQGHLASIETQIFEVVKRDEYTAPYITDISRHFARQGVPLLLPPGVSAD
ncbi:uncharacterized protein UTRI_05058 [Ustilago trichophora]|uniref:Velvet domain-containing protein n=1 Tax=Ustilago trichophora TaxID=86804 RepID=A0A5C3ECX8_9BASI|nr:uncharacterized protein UTRI_05058 [Ustilago trichophora]